MRPATGKNLPPSPPKLPFIGNIHQLSQSLHRDFVSLSERYGKLMLLHIGSKPTLVVSSVDAVREITKTHDLIFSNRPKSRTATRFFYDNKDVAFAPYGDHWRQMKSICVMQLLSNKKVESFRKIRQEEVAYVVEKISRSHASLVNLSEIIVTFTNDVICRAAFGRKYSSNHEGGIDFRELVNEAMELLLVFSLGEFIPLLSWVDRVRGLDSRVENVAKKLDEFLETVVQDHQSPQKSSKKSLSSESDDDGNNGKNFVDILLEYQRENKDALEMDSIKAVLLNMFFAGTETIYTLLEWMMSELIRHPRIMKKVQEEIREIVGGKGRRKVCEDDLEKLNYLKAVIKEAIRLHPPAPLLMFREPSQDVKIDGFDIAKGTQVIINAWAIQRDPAIWEEPEEFRPERFLNSNDTSYDFRGQNVQLIPFGAGRRMCPGISFAMVNAELIAANLLYEFDWKMPGGEECGKLDMAESVGITTHKRLPLMLIATPYK
ncbi:cytochrome P450 736A117-like isoform X2 [Spinacia oleracea]|uniref:Cytochrome P450 736A117-like isoform X2 n=1 Tax=Spinacia oleracea TaxID=3562 RepID=A0A9R0K9E2_SPIOL|nr:cytochrome P450 736A117-like isoform X2 [Spinacia oleracea]